MPLDTYVPPANGTDRGVPTWWRGAVGYQIYLRSFADSDGDGIDDLRRLLGRLDHLADLGVDMVCITPFYASTRRIPATT